MARLAYKWGSSMSLELEAGAENTTTRSDVADEKLSAASSRSATAGTSDKLRCAVPS